MNPTPTVLALLMLGISGVYGQTEAGHDSLSSSATHSRVLLDRRFLSIYPSRQLNSFLVEVPGVWSVNGELHVRGNRANQTGYSLDGFPVLDRYSNEIGISFIPEAIEEVRVSTFVGDTREGMSGGGHVSMRMRQGGDTLRVTARLLSDDVRSPGKRLFNTYSYGWNTAVLTAEGPLLSDARFFIAAESHRARDRRLTYLEPMKYDLVQDFLGSRPPGTPLPGTFEILPNHVPSNRGDRAALQWNITASPPGYLFSVVGNMSIERNASAAWHDVVRSYFRQRRIPSDVTTTTFVGARAGSQTVDGLNISGSVAYLSRRTFTEDPDFGESWLLYSDSASNAAKGYTEFPSRFSGPPAYSVIFGFPFLHPHSPNTQYANHKRSAILASVEGNMRVREGTTLSLSAEAEWWTMRLFSVNIPNYLFSYHQPLTTSWTEADRYDALDQASTGIGFDAYGKESNAGLQRPSSPFFGAIVGTLVNKEGPVTITLGARHRFIALDHTRLKGADHNPLPGTYPAFNYSTSPPSFDETQFESSPVVGYLLPSASIQFEEEALALSLRAGSSLDVYKFSGLLRDPSTTIGRLSHIRRVPYNISPNPSFTYLVRPEKTASVEADIRWKPTPFVTLNGGAYIKRLSDQLQQGRFLDAPNNIPLAGFVNEGESAISGIEGSLEIRIDPSVSLSIAYALSESKGNAPDPSDWMEVSDDPSLSAQYPDLMIPLPYAQNHRLLFNAILDAPASSFLDGFRLGIYGRYLSGHPYTRNGPVQNLGGASPWNIGTRSLIELRNRNPVEPHNASVVPWSTTWDLHAEYTLDAGPVHMRLSVDVTNVFDTRNVVNVYPSTGSPTSDGWLQSPFAQNYLEVEGYEAFYRQINLQNRWSYSFATGGDIYGAPRQILFGVEVGI